MGRISSAWYRKSKDTWYTWVNGRMLSLGVKGRNNKKAAVEALHKLLGGSPDGFRPELRAATTVRELAQKFLAAAQLRVRPTTLIWYERTARGVEEAFGNRPAEGLTPEDVNAWLIKKGWGQATRNHVAGVLKGIYRWGLQNELIKKDPMAKLIKARRVARGGEAVISPEDHKKLLEAATPAFRIVLELLFVSGARPSEIAAITAETFDAAAECIRLAEHKTSRYGHERVIYLTPEAVAILSAQKALYQTGPLLRGRRDTGWTKDSIVLAMRRTATRAGVKVTAYHYRHTFATDLLAAGVPDTIVAQLLGHSSVEMIHRVYGHLGQRARLLKDSLTRVRGKSPEPGEGNLEKP